MIPPGELTGAVLAGGQSRRMGRDKAMLLVNGVPLWQRQVKVLREAGANPVGVVRRPDQPALDLPVDVPLWQDAVAGIGPLAGLHAALAACRTGWLAVVATDMPAIEARWFAWLARHCPPDGGAIAGRDDGLLEPLAAIYPRAALAEAARRLAGPDYSLQAFANALLTQRRLVRLPLGEADLGQVSNWNTPADGAPDGAGAATD